MLRAARAYLLACRLGRDVIGWARPPRSGPSSSPIAVAHHAHHAHPAIHHRTRTNAAPCTSAFWCWRWRRCWMVGVHQTKQLTNCNRRTHRSAGPTSGRQSTACGRGTVEAIVDPLGSQNQSVLAWPDCRILISRPLMFGVVDIVDFPICR